MTVPISHGEGRFIAPQSLIDRLQKNGQIATQNCEYNPNGSYMAIEGTTSPDGIKFYPAVRLRVIRSVVKRETAQIIS